MNPNDRENITLKEVTKLVFSEKVKGFDRIQQTFCTNTAAGFNG